MKVIFLDHDGVICLSNNHGSRFKKNKTRENPLNLPVEQRFDNFDKKAIKVLNRIIEKTDCEIVVTSDWRNWATVAEMGDYYEQQGIIKKPIDYTPFLDNVKVPDEFKWDRFFGIEQERVLETEDWIRNNKITKWVSLDDLHLGRTVINPTGSDVKDWGLKNFIWCPAPFEGIKQTGIEQKVIDFLNE